MKGPSGNRWDYLVVGCGFFGAVFARRMADHGMRSLIIDRRSHIGGNCYTEKIASINVHRYGPHIFHTNDERVWSFLNRFSKFLPYVHKTLVHYQNRMFSFPINLMTFHQLWGAMTPREVEARLKEVSVPCEHPSNCEEWILSQVGREIYEIFFQGYTQKQWNRPPELLPASIVKRVPIRLTYNDRYFNDRYEGIPEAGYTHLFENMLDHELIQVQTGVDYLESFQELRSAAERRVYSGPIDAYFGYRFGELEYRSLRFETEIVQGDHQGIAIINYTDVNVPYTRITEHKHFEGRASLPESVITREYPENYERGKEAYYPIRDRSNQERLERYQQLAHRSSTIFGGRLGSYQYFDMHQVIAQALRKADEELACRGLVPAAWNRAA